MDTQTDPGEVFLQYRPGRRRWLKLVAVLGAVLLLLTIVYSVRWTVFSPTAVVHAYFQALTDRDAAAALRLVDTETTDGLPADLLTAAVLESTDYAPPEDVELAEVTVDGQRAVAQVRFTISGRERTASLRLSRGTGIVDTTLQRWRITDGVRPLRLGEAPGQVTVNGVGVRTQDLDGPRSLLALFGGYQVGVPTEDPLWDARTIRVLVGPDQAREVDVPMVARPEVRAEVERQLVEVLDTCAASAELFPPGCPFGNARIARASDVQWRIASYPQVRLVAGPDGFGGIAMLASPAADGEAVVTGTQQAFGTERPFEIVVPFPVSGVVSERAGAIVFEPSW